MSKVSVYEKFRTILTLNLCNVVDDAEAVNEILHMIDITMDDYDVIQKPKEIIPTNDMYPIIKCYLASKAVANKSMGTLRQYRYKLINFFSTVNKSYKNIEANDIRIYLFNYKTSKNVCDRYIESIRSAISSFYEWLFQNKHVDVNPCDLIEKIKYTEKQRQPLTMYQLEMVRWNCKTTRERALVEFLYSTGCRVCEFVNIMESDVDFNNRSVFIPNGKGGKSRTVFFSASAEFLLKKYMQERTSRDGTLFSSVKAPYGGVKTHAIENTLKKIGERAGLDLYPHRLRHTFATHALHMGMPIERLQALMGHSNPKTTMIYAKIDISDLRLEHQRAYA